MVTGDELHPDRAARASSLFTSPLFHVSGLHSGLVVGLLAGLRLVMIEGRFEPDQGARADPGRGGHHLGDGADDGVAGLRAPGPPRLRHLDGPHRRLRRQPVGRRAAAHGARDVPEREGRGRTPTASPRRARWRRCSSPDEAVERPDSVGRPVPTVRIRIADELGRRAARSARPARCSSPGPTLMAGYWGKPEATAEAIRDGWLHTGDIGYARRRRLPLHHRPQEGHDHPRRREHLLRRDREPPRRATPRCSTPP